ncbi:MAG: hypothetical protein FWH46_06920 [Methanimicrococcus sp.]|nr:hypothetical protein [Methanimicrococcus sp.]
MSDSASYVAGSSSSNTSSNSPGNSTSVIPIIPITPATSEQFQIPDPVSSVTSDTPFNYSSSEYYTRTYSWTYKGYNQTHTLSVPKSYYDYYQQKPHTGQHYNNYALSEYDRPFLGKMIEAFEENGQKNNFTKDEIALNVIAFVQSMPYTSDNVTTGYDEYPRYPIETLVDGGGDCEDSSILAAALLSEMGYDVVLIELPGHMALGIKGNESLPGYYYEDNGSRYYYVETTSSGFGIGEMPSQYKNSKAILLPMTPTPSISVRLNAEYLSHDRDYVYYKTWCTITNHGPTSAQNVTVNIFAEASPYNMTRIWPPEHTIYVGTIQDDGSGYAECVLKVPRKNHTLFSCIVYGDNFNPLDVHTNTIYVD